MLLINSSPRQFVKRLALLWVLLFLCGCGSRSASLRPITPDSSFPAGTPASTNTSISRTDTALASGKSLPFGTLSPRVDGEFAELVNGVLREDAVSETLSYSGLSSARLRNAGLVMPVPTPTVISLFPTRASLHPNQTLRFTAAVTGATHHAVKWLVEGHEGGDASVGTVSATGVYTAPPGPAPWPSVTITAVSAYESKAFASAVVSIMPARSGTASRVPD